VKHIHILQNLRNNNVSRTFSQKQDLLQKDIFAKVTYVLFLQKLGKLFSIEDLFEENPEHTSTEK
jgi:hypothetical protein